MKSKLTGWKLNILGGTPVRGRAEQRHRIHAANEAKLGQISTFNALTGLANCAGLSETVDSEIKRSNRSGRDFAVLVFEVNGMKQINDRHGHMAVNQALCRLLHIFRSSCRSIDTTARYGDDKFAVILPMSGSEAADIVGRRICERLFTDRQEPRLSVSVGIAVYPQDGKSRDALFQAADRALYKGKKRVEEALETFYSNRSNGDRCLFLSAS
jgi:diguanylate cyclase (GGDEF)-like protein